ncbi:MAG TPA: DPP IV N-terminal domain-containing protein [Verrucomicrobiota bacterium]|nr:peptidase [Verrucomicrobiales bacterium]HRI13563.1 DPP IV N-terminal domain-containing protein [Verrucomicrobiota bacterium]
MRRETGLFGISLFLLVAFPLNAAPARTEPQLSNLRFLRDFAETRGFMLGRPTKALPTPDGKAVLFLRSEARVPKLQLYEFDVATGQTRVLLTPEQVLQGAEERLSPEEKARRERMRVSVGGFTDFQLSQDGSRILLSLSGKLYLVLRATGEAQSLNTSLGTLIDPKFAPNGQSVAYVLDHDVFVFDLRTQTERRVTTGGTDTFRHGLAEFVAQEEMDRFSGYWWSPDSKSIAYEESDHEGVEVWHVADAAKPDVAPYPSYYPRPGKNNVKVRLGVIAVDGGDTVWIQWDRERYPYLTSVVWDRFGPLTLAVQSRDQREVVLLAADPVSGRTTTLLTERDAAWVSVRQDVPHWLAEERGFLWASEKAAGWQLEWRSRSGELRQVLVPAGAGFQSLLEVQANSREVFFTARPDPTQSQLYRVSLDGTAPVALTHALGIHSASFGEGDAIFALTTATLSSMPQSTVQRPNGSRVGELPSLAEAPPFIPRVELTQVGAGAGFYAALVRPQNFDKRRRYPVIVNVYGGPLPPSASGMVTASMARWLMAQWLADQGFIVVSIDGRGSPGRDHGWERAIGKHFGSVPLEDQVAGLQALGQKYRELDLKRVGIYGWSFGGYLSALGVLRRPDVFQAAVAGAPPSDWLDYDTHYTERYLGMPDTDAAAYREGSLLTYAGGLKRPLLLIHGTGDDNVYFRHTLKLADALFRAGKEFELLPLSSMTHMTPDPMVTERLYSRIATFFQSHLGRPTR